MKIFSIACLFMSISVLAAEAFPADVQSFTDRREGCDHFRGEPWDDADTSEVKERREFIFQNIKELCTGTDSELTSLREKYRTNPVVTEHLSHYEDRIEIR